jgi:hypothetical protein
MATRLVRVKTRNGVLAGYNTLGESAWNTTGQKIANCVDSLGTSTGISLHLNSAFTGGAGNAATWATAAYHGLDELYWEWSWYSATNGVGIIQLQGFPVGKTVTVGLTGWSLSGTRHTDFLVNGVAATRYTNKSALPPNAPVTIAATADANGYITITGNKTDSFWYINGLTLTYEDQASINSIDKLESLAVSTATTSDSTYAATSVDITCEGVTRTVSATSIGSGSFTFIPPAWVDGETALKYGVANTVVATNGILATSSTTKTLTLTAPLTAVVLTSVSVDSADKVAGFTPPWKVGTQVIYDSSVGTVYADGVWDDLIWDGEFWVSSDFTGTTALWDRDPDDKIARNSSVVVTGGEIPPESTETGVVGSHLIASYIVGQFLTGYTL